MSIGYGNSVSDCQSFDDEHGIEFPTISGNGGGNGITSSYGIYGFPTNVLIAPNHSIAKQDMYPIDNAGDFDSYLQPFGLTHKSCTSGIEEKNVINSFKIYPNPTTDIVNIDMDYTGDVIIKVFNVQGKQIYSSNEHIDYNVVSVNLSDFNEGVYLISINTGNNIINKKVKVIK